MPFSTTFEGCVPFLYGDVKGLVTIAIGCLVDPVEMALDLPLLHEETGLPATRPEIFAAWSQVKARRDLAPHGGMAYRNVTTIRLSPDGIQHVVMGKLRQVDAFMGQRFPGYEDWPAAGQLLVLSMAWAAGSAFRAPRFSAAVNGLDFATAANECHLADADNPGLRPRNAANRLLAMEAEAVLAADACRETLHYPATFAQDAPTRSDLA